MYAVFTPLELLLNFPQTAMLVIKSSAGVAPEVILRNPFHEGDEAGKQGIHYDFESQGRQHQKSTTGVSVAPLKGLMPSI